MTHLAVGPDTRITLHFSLKLENGDVIDSTFDKQPASFTYGDGSLLTGFEKKLLGMRAGDKAGFLINPEHGFGQHNPQNVQTFSRNDFNNDLPLEEGVMMTFADASQSELAGVIKSVSAQAVEVDFNHPLAGRNIQFDVEIIAVTGATGNTT